MAMNLGISSYCLSRKLYSKEWTLFNIMDWAKEHECAHMEVVPFGLPLFREDGKPDMDYACRVGEYADKIGLPLSAFSLNACVIRPGDDEEQGSSSREKNVTVHYHGTREDKYHQEIERIEKYAVPQLYALDPHKLMRSLEDLSLIEHAKIMIRAMKERKLSNPKLSLTRVDYPDNDEEDMKYYLALHQEGGEVKFERIPLRYWGNMKEQYEAHNPDYTGVWKPEK